MTVPPVHHPGNSTGPFCSWLTGRQARSCAQSCKQVNCRKRFRGRWWQGACAWASGKTGRERDLGACWKRFDARIEGPSPGGVLNQETSIHVESITRAAAGPVCVCMVQFSDRGGGGLVASLLSDGL